VNELAEHLWCLREALTRQQCLDLIARSEANGYEAAPLSYNFNGPNGFAVSRDGRNCGRAVLDNAQAAAQLWARLAAQLPAVWRGRQTLGLNERLRFYRYTAGERLGLHRDGFYQRANGEQSLWTLMVYLNQDFTGGATYFAREQLSVIPQTGLALVFPHYFWHEGRPVAAGRKYVLRTDVMFSGCA
jgi:hypothetical protein